MNSRASLGRSHSHGISSAGQAAVDTAVGRSNAVGTSSGESLKYLDHFMGVWIDHIEIT
jgi:hypothetical protein